MIKKAETLFNYSALLFIPLMLFDVFYHHEAKSYYLPLRPYQAFVQNILFLNTVHILITLYFVLTYKRFSNAIKYSLNGKWFKFWLVLILLLVLSVVFLSKSKSLLQMQISDMDLLEIVSFGLFIMFAVVAPIHHIIWQNRGVALYHLGDKTDFSFKKDKILFMIFSVLVLVSGICAFPALGLKLGVYNYAGLFLASLVLSFVIIKSLLRKEYLRSLILCRLFLVAGFAVSPIAGFYAASMHGIEYLFFFRRIKFPEGENEVINRRKRFWILSAVFAVLVLILIPDIPGDVTQWGFVFVGLNIGMSAIHVYADEKIFSFSNSAVRDEIAPLFKT